MRRAGRHRGLLDLALGVLAEVAGADDDGDLGDAALAEDLGVAEREEVKDGGGLLASLAGEVLLALLSRDEGPELKKLLDIEQVTNAQVVTNLVEVDNRLPELVLELVEVPHTDFTEVTGMVLVDVGAVVVGTTGHTTTTGMLPVLADTTVTGRDVATAREEMLVFVLDVGVRLKARSLRALVCTPESNRLPQFAWDRCRRTASWSLIIW